MRRGEVWLLRSRVRPRDEWRLVVSADLMSNYDESYVVAVPVLAEDPGSVLAVGLSADAPMKGWALACYPEKTYQGFLVERLGVVEAETLEQVAAIMRAVLDL